jgi:hypothetical protein
LGKKLKEKESAIKLKKGYYKKVCPNGRGVRKNHQKVQNVR